MSSVPAFALAGLVKRYPGFTLGPLDLTLDPGTVLGFVGPNGSVYFRDPDGNLLEVSNYPAPR